MEQPRSVFGAEEDDLFDDFVTEEPEAPPETETPPEPEPETSAEPAGKEQPAPEPAPEEEVQEPEPEAPKEEQPLIGGKFKNVDQLLTAYENAERRFHEKSQETAEERNKRLALEKAVAEVAPMLRQMAQQQQEPTYDPDDPQQLQQYLDQRAAQIADQRVRQYLEPIEQQQEADRLARAQADVQTYRANNPGSEPYDSEVWEIIQHYQGDEGEKSFPTTPDNLSVALTLAQRPEVRLLVDQSDYIPDHEIVSHAVEAADNPSLLEVIEANPNFLATPKGMAFARKLAGLPQVVQTAKQNASQAQAETRQAERNAAHVETDEGTTLSPAPGKKPQDPLEEYLLEHEAKKQKSIFS